MPIYQIHRHFSHCFHCQKSISVSITINKIAPFWLIQIKIRTWNWRMHLKLLSPLFGQNNWLIYRLPSVKNKSMPDFIRWKELKSIKHAVISNSTSHIHCINNVAKRKVRKNVCVRARACLFHNFRLLNGRLDCKSI